MKEAPGQHRRMHQAGLGPSDAGPDYDDGRLRIRPRDYVASADGVVLHLTPRQLALLAELASEPGRVRTRDELLEAVWESEPGKGTRVVDVAIAHVRARLAEALPDRAYIHTHPRIGYRFAAEPASGREAPPASAPRSPQPPPAPR
jgi:DNA-binding response OmpR family regulator